MISRIVPFFIFLFWVPTAFGLDPVFQLVDETPILTLNLTQEMDEATQQRILTAIEEEIKNPKNSSLRKDELFMAQGLVELNQKNRKAALLTFGKVSPVNLLSDAALFYSMKTSRLLGEEALQNGQILEAKNSCVEARNRWIDLDNYVSTPFEEPAKVEMDLIQTCIVRAALRLNQLSRVSPFFFGPATDDLDLKSTDAEDFLIHFARVLKEQDLPLEANLLIEQSLSKSPSFQRLAALKVAPPGSKSENSPPKSKTKSEIIYKNREIPDEQMLSQATNKQNQGNFDQAMNLLVQLIKEYPGSVVEPKAETRMISLLDTLIKRKKKLDSFISKAKTLPADSMYEVGKFLWQKDQDDAAYDLLQNLLSKNPEGAKPGNAYYILGRIEENRENFEKARSYFKLLVAKYSASPFFEAAHFKIGFLSYLLSDNKTALEWLEYHRTLTRSSYAQAKALYWIAQIYEKDKQIRKADTYKDDISHVAPLSFYAFMVNRLPEFEKTSSKVFSGNPKNFPSAFLLARTKALLAAGLHEAGSKFLGTVDLEQEPQLSSTVGNLYAAIHQHNTAFKLAYTMSEQLGVDATLPSDVSKLLFPIEFNDTIRKEAVSSNLDPMLLFSLIKQESAYRENAESRVGALGLMQLMPDTASSVASEGRFAYRGKRDLLNGDLNIKLGARYLSNTIKQYNGNAIYAIAAYNAGPERVNIWVKQWGNLPTPEFMELIPFEETKNYVKSIVRNYAFYSRMLEDKSVDITHLTQYPTTAKNP